VISLDAQKKEKYRNCEQGVPDELKKILTQKEHHVKRFTTKRISTKGKRLPERGGMYSGKNVLKPLRSFPGC